MPVSCIGRQAVLALAATGLLSAVPGPATAAPAEAKTQQIVITDGMVRTVKESAGTPVECPQYQVMIGRSHQGDENGNTTYQCGFIRIDNQFADIGDATWTASRRESDSSFSAPAGQAMVGRVHSGDENGSTRHANARMTWQGRTLHLTSYRWTAGMRESGSHSKAGPGEVMAGRQHRGDENGTTWYLYAKVALG